MIDINRIRRDIEAIAAFNSTPGQGCTRFTYSPEDRQARDYLIQQMQALNLTICTDPVGNIRARKEGSVPGLPPVLVGSHIDTVWHGGNFDGVLGVAAGLEVLRQITEEGLAHAHPIELIIFAEEEGPNFGYPLAGSKALVGTLTAEAMKDLANAQGITMYQGAREFGLEPEKMAEHLLKPGEVKAMLELHIEQSVVLEREGIPVGIVENIAGGKWLGITIQGVANHAGATPMQYRNDPMAGAAAIICSLESLLAEAGTSTTVATVGRIECSPNAPNVIPGQVFFTVDVRDIGEDAIEAVCLALTEKVYAVAQSRGLLAKVKLMGDTKPVQLSAKVAKELITAARDLGIVARTMNSGALHDACIMTAVTDVGMVFVPSIGGRSHAPEERTRYEDIEKGCNVLLRAVLSLAQ